MFARRIFAAEREATSNSANGISNEQQAI